MQPDPFVVFATPTFTGQTAYEFAGAMGRVQWLLGQHGIRTSHRFWPGVQFVEVARNLLVTKFLEENTDATDLFFIDDDVGGFKPEKVLEFITRPEDVLAGVPPLRTSDGPPQYPVYLAANRERDDGGELHGNPSFIENNGLFKAQQVPAGFLRIKRHVLERFAKESPTYTFNTLENPKAVVFEIFDRGSRNGEFHGEDFLFCQRCHEAGIEIWVDPDIKFTHRGQYIWGGKFRDEIDKVIAGTHPIAQMREVA